MRTLFHTCGTSAVILAAVFAGAARGQDAPDTGLNLRVDTTLVQIPVAVTDSLNRFVLGLQKEDFHLSEDGVEQTVAHFSGEDAPLSVGLVFDESGSMDYKLRTSQAAVAQFLKTMNADDEAFLVEFSDSAKAFGRIHRPRRGHSRRAQESPAGRADRDARRHQRGAERNEEGEEFRARPS